jgi:hypothetical protein
MSHYALNNNTIGQVQFGQVQSGQIQTVQVSQNIQYINGIPHLATHYIQQPIQTFQQLPMQSQIVQTQTPSINSAYGSNQRPMMQPIIPPTYQTITLSNNPTIGFPISYVIRK